MTEKLRLVNRVFLGCALLAVIVVTFMVGLISGVLLGVRSTYHRRYLAEAELVGPVLTNDARFSRVTIHEYSGGGAYLSGEVPTEADRDRLRTEMTRLLGETKADFLVNGVAVTRPAEP